MKFIALALALTTTNALANSEAILKKVDAFLANDTYSAAFACGDKATLSTSLGDYQGVSQEMEVTKCGAVTEIRTTDGEDVWTLAFNAEAYNAIKGNPLRIAEEEGFSKGRFSEDLEWTSATAFQMDYLGAKRNALKVTGKGEVCLFDEDGNEDCQEGQVVAYVVQGVPMLARMSSLSILVPQFGAWVTQNVSAFSRNK